MTEVQTGVTSTDAPYYTGKGDHGKTVLGHVGEIDKHDVRLAVFADCEEANAAVGSALAFGGISQLALKTLANVQNDLFDAMADVSTPMSHQGDPPPVRIVQDHVDWVERACRHYSAELPTAEGYVLPGGTMSAGLLFQARTVVRRAERTTWAAVDQHHDLVNPMIATYLNRLSSLLFVLARVSNEEHGDTVWRPLASVTAPPENGNGGGAAAPPPPGA